MPVQIKVTGIFPPKNVMQKQGQAVLDALEHTMQGSVRRRIERAMEARVKNWDAPPQIRSTYRSLPTRFVLEVMPFGRGKSKWVWVTEGVKPHAITVKRAKVLTIKGGKGGYSPHTAPGNVYGGPGSYAGVTQYAKAVMHPGSQPRKFEENIVREEEDAVRRDLEAAVRRAAS